MKNLHLSSSYSQALSQIALERDALQQVYEDLVLFTQLCNDHKLLLETLQSPIIQGHKKLSILHKLFASKVHALTLRLFYIAIQRSRAAMLSNIAACFIAQYHRYKAIKTVHITTSFPLSNDLIIYFKKFVLSIVPCQEVLLIQHIKPSIRGGFILQVDDKQLDESLKTKLSLLKKHCTTSGY